MSRRLSILSVAAMCVGLIGCGGDKSDFATKPAKYSIVTSSPSGADGVTLTGVSRDGRVMGTYLKAGVSTVFGWTPDGEPSQITLPTECKAVHGINELGGVECSNMAAVPQQLFRWQSGATDELRLPANAVLDSFGAITFDSYFLVNLHVGAGPTRGYQIKIDEDPKVWTNDGGALLGSSLDGNITGFDMDGALSSAIAIIDEKKVSCGLFQGSPTIGYGINDSGVVVGASRDHAVRWQNGNYSQLPMPAGATAAKALDINNEGVICGEATVNGVSEACVWFKTGAFLLKNMVTRPAGVHFDRARLVTPLGIVIVEGTRNGKAEVFGLFPEFP